MFKTTTWLLVGLENGSESAEDSGIMLIKESEGLYKYEMADANNIKIAEGALKPDEVTPDPEYDKNYAYILEYAAAEKAVYKEGLCIDYLDLQGEGDDAEKAFREDVDSAGSYIALCNMDSTKPDDRYVIIRTSDNTIVGYFKDSGDAFDAMCSMNKAM